MDFVGGQGGMGRDKHKKACLVAAPQLSIASEACYPKKAWRFKFTPLGALVIQKGGREGENT